MGVRAASSYSNTQANPLPAGGTETVVLATGPVVLAADNAQVLIAWMLAITTGSPATFFHINLRRGTSSIGTLVNAAVWAQTVVASSSYMLSGWYVDMPGVAQTGYVLTFSQQGGSGASTWNDGSLVTFVL